VANKLRGRWTLVGITLLLAILCLGASIGPGSALWSYAQTGGTSMEAPLKTGLQNGVPFGLDIVIDTDVATRGAQFRLQFDPAVIQCQSPTEGAFYSTWASAHGASTLLYPNPAVNNTEGYAEIGVAVMGGQSGGPTGRGVFATMQCTPQVATGMSPLTFVVENSLSEIVGADAMPISDARFVSGTVYVGQKVYLPAVLRNATGAASQTLVAGAQSDPSQVR